MELIWSSGYSDYCSTVYDWECTECDICKNGVTDYQLLDDLIMADLREWFEKNNYHYCVFRDGLDNGISRFCNTIEELLFDVLYVSNCFLRIYKGDYNSLFIEINHHDGSQLFQIARLNKKGLKKMERMDWDYMTYYYDDENQMLEKSKNYKDYLYTSVYNDFKNNW